MINHIHENPSFCPECRYLPSTEVTKIRNAFKANPDCNIAFKCWNYEEVMSIKALLRDDEIKRIQFSWMRFVPNKKINKDKA